MARLSTFVEVRTALRGSPMATAHEALFTSGIGFDLEVLATGDGACAHLLWSAISRNGHVTTIAGNGVIGYAEGNGSTAEFSNPYAVAVDACGTI